MELDADNRVIVSPRSYARLRSLLIRRSNLNISLYKDVYLRRRLRLRMRVSQCKTTEDYLRLAENSPEEYRKLVSTLTINVTRFFRNIETFKKINEVVIPEIVKNREERGENKINVLSVGCSTGEEPYSIAILFLEYFKKKKKDFNFRVIGTDVDKKALFVAIKGIYSKDKVIDVPEEILNNYFNATDRGYQVSSELRSSVVFLKKDVLTHRVHRRFDLILARNILIYFSRSYQEVIEERFHKQLVPGGFLSLGRTESLVGKGRKLFSAVSVPDRIYRAK
jgi:chemotaxis protein methyltransferase CheR